MVVLLLLISTHIIQDFCSSRRSSSHIGWICAWYQWHLSHEKKKNLVTFHYTAWLLGNFIMAYYNPHITGKDMQYNLYTFDSTFSHIVLGGGAQQQNDHRLNKHPIVSSPVMLGGPPWYRWKTTGKKSTRFLNVTHHPPNWNEQVDQRLIAKAGRSDGYVKLEAFLPFFFFPEKFIFPPPPEILFALPSWGSVWDAVTSNPMTSVPKYRFLGCTTLHETNSLPLKIHLFLLSRCYVSFREGIEDWF